MSHNVHTPSEVLFSSLEDISIFTNDPFSPESKLVEQNSKKEVDWVQMISSRFILTHGGKSLFKSQEFSDGNKLGDCFFSAMKSILETCKLYSIDNNSSLVVELISYRNLLPVMKGIHEKGTISGNIYKSVPISHNPWHIKTNNTRVLLKNIYPALSNIVWTSKSGLPKTDEEIVKLTQQIIINENFNNIEQFIFNAFKKE